MLIIALLCSAPPMSVLVKFGVYGKEKVDFYLITDSTSGTIFVTEYT